MKTGRVLFEYFGPPLSVIPTFLYNHKTLKLPCSLVGVVLEFLRKYCLCFNFYPEDGGGIFPETLELQPECSVLHHRKPQYQVTVLAAWAGIAQSV